MLIVSCGSVSHSVPYIDMEDGLTYHQTHEYYVVSFSTPYGLEWTHTASFPLTIDGRQKAERLTARVQAVLNEKGTDGLNQDFWNQRVIYGSQAYQDDEAGIVDRERQDDMMGG